MLGTADVRRPDGPLPVNQREFRLGADEDPVRTVAERSEITALDGIVPYFPALLVIDGSPALLVADPQSSVFAEMQAAGRRGQLPHRLRLPFFPAEKARSCGHPELSRCIQLKRVNRLSFFQL